MIEKAQEVFEALGESIDKRGLLVAPVDNRDRIVRWEAESVVDVKFVAPGGYRYSLGALINPIMNKVVSEDDDRDAILLDVKAEVIAFGRRASMAGEFAEERGETRFVS